MKRLWRHDMLVLGWTQGGVGSTMLKHVNVPATAASHTTTTTTSGPPHDTLLRESRPVHRLDKIVHGKRQAATRSIMFDLLMSVSEIGKHESIERVTRHGNDGVHRFLPRLPPLPFISLPSSRAGAFRSSYSVCDFNGLTDATCLDSVGFLAMDSNKLQDCMLLYFDSTFLQQGGLSVDAHDAHQPLHHDWLHPSVAARRAQGSRREHFCTFSERDSMNHHGLMGV